jgi:UPF0755 protein
MARSRPGNIMSDESDAPRNPRPAPRGDTDTEAPESTPKPRRQRTTRTVVVEGPSGTSEQGAGAPERTAPIPKAARTAVADARVADAAIDYTDDGWVTLPRRSSRSRRIITAVVFITVIGLVGSGLVWRWVQQQIHPPGPEGAPIEFEIQSGAATSEIAADLAREDIIGNPTVFRIWLNRNGGGDFQAGIYDMHKNMDFADAVEILRGPARAVTEFRVTVPPGLTIAQIKGKLMAQLQRFNGPELDVALASPDVALKWAPPTATNREGIFFPDTYNLDERTAADELGLLVRMRDETQKVATELDIEGRAAALGVSPWEVLVVASLVEREAKVDPDRAKIARVIYNRLQRDMKLEIDATVLYAVNKDRGLTLTDLNVDSPYNTYKVKGLPPTPIAAPSRKSIEAALNPADGRWLWYVLTDKSGAHTFAETEKAFLAAKEICEREKLCG